MHKATVWERFERGKEIQVPATNLNALPVKEQMVWSAVPFTDDFCHLHAEITVLAKFIQAISSELGCSCNTKMMEFFCADLLKQIEWLCFHMCIALNIALKQETWNNQQVCLGYQTRSMFTWSPVRLTVAQDFRIMNISWLPQTHCQCHGWDYLSQNCLGGEGWRQQFPQSSKGLQQKFQLPCVLVIIALWLLEATTMMHTDNDCLIKITMHLKQQIKRWQCSQNNSLTKSWWTQEGISFLKNSSLAILKGDVMEKYLIEIVK